MKSKKRTLNNTDKGLDQYNGNNKTFWIFLNQTIFIACKVLKKSRVKQKVVKRYAERMSLSNLAEEMPTKAKKCITEYHTLMYQKYND